MQGEKGPQNLRGVHAEEAATSHAVHPVVHLSGGEQGEAEHVTGARHGESPVHHPIFFTVQEYVGICRQVFGVQAGRVAGRQAKQQRSEVGQTQMAHFDVQRLAHVQRPVAEHQSLTAVQEVDAGCRAVRGEYHIRAPDRVKVQVIVQRGGKAPRQPRDAECAGRGRGRRGRGGRGGAAGDELCVVIELESGHLGSNGLVVLQLIVVVIG